jgi:hypothetical protein
MNLTTTREHPCIHGTPTRSHASDSLWMTNHRIDTPIDVRRRLRLHAVRLDFERQIDPSVEPTQSIHVWRVWTGRAHRCWTGWFSLIYLREGHFLSRQQGRTLGAGVLENNLE